MTNSFHDLFGNPFGKGPGDTPGTPAPEKGVQIRGQKIDGEFYVRAADVVALLEANGLLPGITEKLRKASAS